MDSPLAKLFPDTVAICERRTVGNAADLHPTEAQFVQNAAVKRIQEFAAGRACARSALAELGAPNVALHPALDRQPIWPAGFVGSITHTTGLCVSVAAARRDVRAIGLDSEVVGAPTAEVWPTICGDKELDWVNSLRLTERAAAVTLAFSAKEALYKCQYPLTGEWLDFHDLDVAVPDWGQAEGSFIVRATRPLLFARHVEFPLTGRYAFHEQFVSAGVIVPEARVAQ